METVTIDKKDRVFLKKIARIRCEKAILKKKKTRNHLIFSAVILVFTVLVFSVSVYKTSNKSVHRQDKNITSSDRDVPAPSPSEETASYTDAAEMEAPPPVRSAQTPETFTGTKGAVSRTSAEISETELSGETETAGIKPEPAVLDNASSGPASNPSALHISRLAVCQDIDNRMPVGKRSVFSINRDRYATVWTEVKTESPPGVITHIYYLNDEKYCEVRLAVRHRRMRTWSRITLSGNEQVGRWRVDVVSDEGTVLKQADFQVNS